MINLIDQWIDQTLLDFSDKKVSCNFHLSDFNGFYPLEFLSASSFVVVNEIPKPNFPELRQAGLGDFIDMDVDAITYKDTYFIKRGKEDNLVLHFHELVHVLQWKYLGAYGFINRYIGEIQNFGYDNAPLEKMAYGLQDLYLSKSEAFNIPDYVQQKI